MDKGIEERISDLELGSAFTTSASSDEAGFANQQKTLDLELKREELEGRKQDRKQRGKFSMRIFVFVCVYMMMAIAILACNGAGWLTIDDTVLIAMLTTTTANVIGLFVVVANYLFHHK